MLGLMELNATLVIQWINFLILFLVLRHFLFKPTTEFMSNRQAKIQASFDEAELKNKQTDELKAKYENKLLEIKKERNELIQEASKKAQQRGDEIIRQAEEEAVRIKERASLEVERERQKAMNELKKSIAQLSVEIAAKVVEKELDQNAHSVLIEQFVDKAGDAQWQN